MLLLRTPLFLAYIYLLYLLSSAAERNPPRPIISETFTSEVNVSISNVTGNYTVTIFGEGHISRDYSQSKQLINIVLDEESGHPHVYLQLKRYDLKRIFTFTESLREKMKDCHSDEIKGPFGEVWSWIYSAMYVGTVIDRGNKFEVWNYTVNNAVTNSIWVNESWRGQPIRYILDNIKQKHTVVVNFEVFKPKAPTDPNEYDVPKICYKTPLPGTEEHVMNFGRDFDDTED